MNPAFCDPNNHAPAARPDDAWSDVEGCLTGVIVIEEYADDPMQATLPLAELPPRRTKEVTAAPPRENGLRIEPQIHRHPQALIDSPHREDDFDRSVVRLDPESPRVLKAPRPIAFQERPSKPKRDRRQLAESQEWGMARRSSTQWIIGLFIAAAVIVVGSLAILPLINKTESFHPHREDLVVEHDDNPTELLALNEIYDRKDEAIRIFKKIISAKSVDDILPYLRDREHVENLVRSTPWMPLAPADWNPPSDFNWEVYQENGRAIGILDSTLPGFANPAFYFIIENRQLLVDWKASTGYGTAGFEDLEKGSGDGSEIRAIISKSDFYTNVYPESGYQSYQLFTPKAEGSIWVYTRHGESADSLLHSLTGNGPIIQEGQDRLRLTLRLSRSASGALPNQWLVEDILHSDWIHH